MQNHRKLFIPLVVAAMLALPAVALAHAFLDHAEPKVGSTVQQPPKQIKLWFTQDLEPAFSTIEVRDSRGQQVDKKDAKLDAKDPKLLIVSIPKLANGQYTVTWSVVSTDTHRTHGDFKFTVKTGS